MRAPNGDAIAAALDAGIRRFDTARAYIENERLLANVLRTHPRGAEARVITKCGMRRDGGAWIPDGRAKSIWEDAEASIEALNGVPIDVLLLHAPDPRVPLSTSTKALGRVLEAGLVRRVGVSNVSRKQLEQIASSVPVASVEVALGAYDDLAIRGGVVAYCIEHGIEILAHAPLGGPERAARLDRDLGADTFLAYLLAVRPEIVPIVGVTRVETVTRIANAAKLELTEDQLASLDARFPALGALRRPASTVAAPRDAEIVLMMGIAGAGKSSAAEEYVARGYERLNRDTLGGTLRAIAQRLDERLSAGGTRFVLDNTYVARAWRNDVLNVAARHGARVRCVFFETPLHEAQVNAVNRMIDIFGHVLTPEEIAAHSRANPAAFAPHALSRLSRNLEPPMLDEGFAEITSVPFVRRHPYGGRPGLFVPLAAIGNLNQIIEASPSDTPCLLFGWRPEASEESLAPIRATAAAIAQSTGRTIEVVHCPHPAGPPICWCRPPLPGLFLEFAHRHAINLRASAIYTSSPSDRTVARNLDLTFLRPSP